MHEAEAGAGRISKKRGAVDFALEHLTLVLFLILLGVHLGSYDNGNPCPSDLAGAIAYCCRG